MRRRHALALVLPTLPALSAWRTACAAGSEGGGDDAVRRGRTIGFARDHGAHLATQVEWWYVTGWLGQDAQNPSHGFQVTFFRRRTGLAEGVASRFAARHLLMGHAALTDLRAGKHRHAERVARWSGSEDTSLRARASLTDADVVLAPWRMARHGEGASSVWRCQVDDRTWSLALTLQTTQPVLLQGEGGYSRKGPGPDEASHYYTEPQLTVTAQLRVDGLAQSLSGKAWLDHEWSNTLLPPQAVGWDWIGINFDDGSALTAFQLRRADGSALWAGGSFRKQGGAVQAFEADAVRFTAGRRWRSPSTAANYPVQWTVTCPAGRFAVRSVLDAQELDARASTGTVYWEGLSSLHDETTDQRMGWGYLEMTGYAAPLRW